MYVSYGIGIVYIGVLAILANAFLVPRIGVVPAAGCIVAIHLACVPAVFRYSRVIWAHLNVGTRSEEHTSELQSRLHLVCRLLLEKKKTTSLDILPLELADTLQPHALTRPFHPEAAQPPAAQAPPRHSLRPTTQLCAGTRP